MTSPDAERPSPGALVPMQRWLPAFGTAPHSSAPGSRSIDDRQQSARDDHSRPELKAQATSLRRTRLRQLEAQLVPAITGLDYAVSGMIQGEAVIATRQGGVAFCTPRLLLAVKRLVSAGLILSYGDQCFAAGLDGPDIVVVLTLLRALHVTTSVTLGTMTADNGTGTTRSGPRRWIP